MTLLPTRNSQLAFSRATFRSVPEMLDYAARGETGVTFYTARGERLAALTWCEIRDRAHVVARKLIGAGFARGDRLLITADTWPGFFDTFFGAQYAGMLPVPVSIPVGIGGKEAYLEQLRRQFAASGAVAAVGIDDLAGFLAEAAAEFPDLRLHGGVGAIDSLPEKPVDLRPLGPDDDCYIQFSSGSTRHPHGVRIQQSALMANLAGITGPAGLDVVIGDRAVSWLPLYHDMGLIGFLMAPLSSQLSIDYLTPRDFARRPMQWLNLISRNRASIAYSPSFGYDLATRRGAMQVPDDLDLSTWRVAGIGGDMVRAEVLERFAAAFEPKGFNRSAFIPSYGMAEVCLAITFCPHGTGFRTDTVDRAALGNEQRAVPAADSADAQTARRFVVCGRVLPGHQLEVRDESGTVLGDRQVGRIFVKGPSIMPGYFNEPEASHAVLSKDGWLDTGDLGYLLDGEIVVTGRAKDLIIVHGRNVWPQDIEWAIEGRRLVKTGDSAAFSVDSGEGERVVVAVVARVSGDEARAELARDVAGAVREAVVVDCEVVLVPPALGLPMTSSGKLSRARARANYLAGLYAPPPSSTKPAAA
ncbi:fatty-acyl-CoA synthase [Enhydrobacter aerosaccus]|uniref:Fatty-acyl-CoA synthase n=1 Tax=Enhydrobacter aerosaccus TaxID=225324 RepID=A0A1T4SVY9_9HYPH|nr:fatty acyl-AMP ligase [Enhydrobacter aerosaccus]SKA32424.1 fatty-acyl-CoA synthase [Enhydrobacter aerosaccus]